MPSPVPAAFRTDTSNFQVSGRTVKNRTGRTNGSCRSAELLTHSPVCPAALTAVINDPRGFLCGVYREQRYHGGSLEPVPGLRLCEVTGAPHRAATCCWLAVTQRRWAAPPGCRLRCCCCCCWAAVLRSRSAGPWTHRGTEGFCLWTDRRTKLVQVPFTSNYSWFFKSDLTFKLIFLFVYDGRKSL